MHRLDPDMNSDAVVTHICVYMLVPEIQVYL